MLLNPMNWLLAQPFPKALEAITKARLRVTEPLEQTGGQIASHRHTSGVSYIHLGQVSKLGEILVLQKLVSEAELSMILEEQPHTGRQLGALLLNKLLISEEQLQQALINQRIRLGELLIRKRLISHEILQDFLNSQTRTHQFLGQLLVQADWISAAQLESVLKEQYWRRNGYWVID